MKFEIHDLQWTPEKTRRFWRYYHGSQDQQEAFFSKQVGAGIVNFTKRYSRLEGRVLDYGAGPGYLIDTLLKGCGGFVWGCDFSGESADMVNSRLRNEPRFRGCVRLDALPSSLPAGHFDSVFLIETLEHLTDDNLSSTITEIRRVLSDTGILIVTVPNAETLGLHNVICPDCGAVFHRVQHLRNFTKASLAGCIDSFGFETVACEETDLNWYGKPGIRALAKRVLAVRSGRQLPHLIYAGRKTLNGTEGRAR